LITEEMSSRMDQIRADIVSGAIQVHDYYSTNSCEI
jgi:basic membrane protein A